MPRTDTYEDEFLKGNYWVENKRQREGGRVVSEQSNATLSYSTLTALSFGGHCVVGSDIYLKRECVEWTSFTSATLNTNTLETLHFYRN